MFTLTMAEYYSQYHSSLYLFILTSLEEGNYWIILDDFYRKSPIPLGEPEVIFPVSYFPFSIFRDMVFIKQAQNAP